MDKIEHACTFANRLLENGSDGEILMLKNVVTKQLEILSDNLSSKPKCSPNLEFVTDLEDFKNMTKVSTR